MCVTFYCDLWWSTIDILISAGDDWMVRSACGNWWTLNCHVVVWSVNYDNAVSQNQTSLLASWSDLSFGFVSDSVFPYSVLQIGYYCGGIANNGASENLKFQLAPYLVIGSPPLVLIGMVNYFKRKFGSTLLGCPVCDLNRPQVVTLFISIPGVVKYFRFSPVMVIASLWCKSC